MDKKEVEAQLFSKYLIGRLANTQAVNLFKAASVQKLDAYDQKLINYMTAHPWSIGFIDAGLVFIKPASGARRRLYLMLAILEANTEYTDLFLAKNRSSAYLLVVAGAGIRALIRSLLGIALIKTIKP